jgi:hypothetical protein
MAGCKTVFCKVTSGQTISELAKQYEGRSGHNKRPGRERPPKPPEKEESRIDKILNDFEKKSKEMDEALSDAKSKLNEFRKLKEGIRNV